MEKEEQALEEHSMRFFFKLAVIVMLAFASALVPAQDASHAEPTVGKCVVALCDNVISAENYAVVLPAEPTPSERHAAKELCSFLEQITGQKLRIISEDEPMPSHVIIVGRNAKAAEYGFDVDYGKLGLEGIHIENRDGNLMLAGGQRGVLYAVYSFLEDYLGCHWFTADCSVVPNQGKVELRNFIKTYIPPLEYRETDYPKTRLTEFGVRNKLNGYYSKADANWGGHHTYCGFVHTFYQLVPPSKYAATHPEYFSEINGKRVTDHAQLCLTNPEVRRIAAETIREWMREHPEATIFSVSQNDWYQFCTCKECTALAEKEESQCGPLLHFVNYIADAVRDEFPDKIVDTLAYQYTRKPPKYVRPAPNVCVRLCSIECCFAHSLEECPTNRTFVNDITEWSKICNRLHIWDYVINYAHCMQPFPNFRVIQPNIDFFVRHGVTGIYEEANYFSKGGELAELRAYVMAKCLWEPSYDVHKAITDFTEAYYGAAGVYIRKYLDVIHTICDNKDLHIGIFDDTTKYLNDKKMLAEADDALKAAADAVRDNEMLLRRVQLATWPLIYTRLSLFDKGILKASELGCKSVGGIAEQIDFIKKVAECESIERVSEGRAFYNWFEAIQKKLNDVMNSSAK